jgi:1,2-diacylglycerol 3-beta-galactosyltransferase
MNEPNIKPIKILFLSSDTGGGHRASAEALGAQFLRLFPGSSYALTDCVKDHGFNGIEDWYQHLSSHPLQWNFVYKFSNIAPVHGIVKAHLKLTTERSVRHKISEYMPDVVVSVHPLMTNVPASSCKRISSETGKHLPIFTVVTDLGSGHKFWFGKHVERIFVASEKIRELARKGHIPDEKIVMSGLPIRYDFALEAEALGSEGRSSLHGKIHQLHIRKKLGIILDDHDDDYRKVLLVMGGGEGVGSLSNIVNSLYIDLRRSGIQSTILVVCGRNGRLKESLETRQWEKVYSDHMASNQRDETNKGLVRSASDLVLNKLPNLIPFKVIGKFNDTQDSTTPNSTTMDKETSFEKESSSNVIVTPLGFITNIAEYMVAADVLITKAGPGTIVEAASVGLPVLTTSYLPGQEEGNVDFVIEKKFGAYKSDSKPFEISECICEWLQDPDLMVEMSKNAQKASRPNAAEDIARAIGTSVLRWKELHPENEEDDNDSFRREDSRSSYEA